MQNSTMSVIDISVYSFKLTLSIHSQAHGQATPMHMAHKEWWGYVFLVIIMFIVT